MKLESFLKRYKILKERKSYPVCCFCKYRIINKDNLYVIDEDYKAHKSCVKSRWKNYPV